MGTPEVAPAPAAEGQAVAAADPPYPPAEGKAPASNGVDEHKANASAPNAPAPMDVEAIAKQAAVAQEEKRGDIVFRLCQNDGTPENMERLVALKNIFAKQLPKMPREYIVRLVFDRRHRSVALCRGNHVIGGICYRPYFEQKFSEIAFCAVTATEQVKGYGTRLMNHTKEQAKAEGILYFLTYADNYAIGYFRKQGFTKNLTMPKAQWTGFIKDYDGAHLMECYIHPTINFLDVPSLLRRQKDFILNRIRLRSQSHVVYPGLPLERFEAGKRIASPMDIPGLKEAGWGATLGGAFSQRENEREKLVLQSFLQYACKEVQTHRAAWPFQEPVDVAEVPDYVEVITDPIDLSAIKARLDEGDYYRSKEMLQADMLRMCKNCKTYNQPTTPFYAAGQELEAFIRSLFKTRDG